jgi:hypothetical protein
VTNNEKTTATAFDTLQNKSFLRPKIRFANMEIKYKYETKFLGLHLTEILKQDININNLSSKLSRSFYVILSLECTKSLNILRTTYFAHLHSHLIYQLL